MKDKSQGYKSQTCKVFQSLRFNKNSIQLTVASFRLFKFPFPKQKNVSLEPFKDHRAFKSHDIHEPTEEFRFKETFVKSRFICLKIF